MRWKKILVILAIALAALIGVAYGILASYDFNRFKPRIAQVVKEATGRELKMDGDLRLRIGLTTFLQVEKVSFQNALWGSRPELAMIKRFEMQVSLWPLLFKKIVVNRLVLVEPDILIETDKSGRSNLEFATPEAAPAKKPEEAKPADGPEKQPTLAVKELSLEKGLVVYKDGRAGKEYRTAVEKFTVSAKDMESPIDLKLKGVYNDLPIELAASLGSVAEFTVPGKPWPINLTAKVAGADLTLEGTIKDPRAMRGLDVKVAAKGKELESFEKIAGKPLPIKGGFDLSVRLTDPAEKVYRMADLKVLLAGSDLNGAVEINLAGKKPKLTASLTSRKLALLPLLPAGGDKEGGKTASPEAQPAGKAATKGGPEAGAKAEAKGEAKEDRLFSKDPLPLAGLEAVNADIKLKAGQIFLPKLPISNLEMTLALNDGHLKVQVGRAVIGGGVLAGRVGLQTQGKTVLLDLSLKVDRLEVKRVLQELKAAEVFEGTLGGEFNLQARGDSVAALMAGLNGKTFLTMGKGRVKNKYIDALGGEGIPAIFRLLNPSQEGEYTVVNCFVSGFAIKDGIAKATALVLDTDEIAVVGFGEVNLENEKLNFGLNLVPKGGHRGDTLSKISQSLSELSKSLKLGGTLAKPSLAIDSAQAALTLGKALGGGALFGPAGIAAALAGGGSAGENPCLAAIEAAKKGMVPAAEPEKKSSFEQEVLKGLEGALKDFLGK